MTSDRASRSPAVSRAVKILLALAEDPQHPVRPSELSRRVNVPKATVLNLCAALTDAQLLRQDPRGYMLGRRLAELGKAYLASVGEVEEFYLVCREHLGSVRQTAQLAVLGDGMNVVYLARYDGTDPLHLGLVSEIGRSVPAQCTAAGKALLAALDPGELAERVATGPLQALTEHSITDVGQLDKELARIRERGYAMEREEVVPGLRCFGTHLDTPHREDGLIAVSFTFRTAGFADADSERAASDLREFAETLGVRIGASRSTDTSSAGEQQS